MNFHVVLEKQKEGGYVAYIPELPGCHTQGETKAEAIENVKEARDLYLEVLKSKRQVLTAVEVLPLSS